MLQADEEGGEEGTNGFYGGLLGVYRTASFDGGDPPAEMAATLATHPLPEPTSLSPQAVSKEKAAVAVRAQAARPLLLAGRRVSLARASPPSSWSRPLSCETEGSSWNLTLGDCDLALSVQAAPSAAPRSKLLVVHARYRILNRSGRALRYRACWLPDGPTGWLSPDQDAPIPIQFGATATPDRCLQLSQSTAADLLPDDWSGAFAVDRPVDAIVEVAAAPSDGDGRASPTAGTPTAVYVQVTVESNRADC